MKPRLSIATTLSTARSPHSTLMRSSERRKRASSRSSVVMSLNTMPGFGKSGTSRIAARRSATCCSRSMELADVEPARAALGDRLAVDAADAGEGGTLLEPVLELREGDL